MILCPNPKVNTKFNQISPKTVQFRTLKTPESLSLIQLIMWNFVNGHSHLIPKKDKIQLQSENKHIYQLTNKHTSKMMQSVRKTNDFIEIS